MKLCSVTTQQHANWRASIGCCFIYNYFDGRFTCKECQFTSFLSPVTFQEDTRNIAGDLNYKEVGFDKLNSECITTERALFMES